MLAGFCRRVVCWGSLWLGSGFQWGQSFFLRIVDLGVVARVGLYLSGVWAHGPSSRPWMGVLGEFLLGTVCPPSSVGLVLVPRGETGVRGGSWLVVF